MTTVPLSGTSIALFSGIPFGNDYKHTRWFDSLSDQQNWFGSQTVVASIAQANFQRIEGQPYLSVNMNVDQLWNVNYISFQNADYAKTFYAFVTNIEYVQRNTCYIHFEIDVMQTWRFDYNFKPSYVVREHCPLWNTDGSPVINTVDEGLNYGTEYDNVLTINYQPNDGYKWMVIMSKTPIHTGVDNTKVAPTVIGTPQPLSVYLVPFKDDDNVPAVNTSTQSINISKPSQILTNIYSATTAVNNIVSIYITDYPALPFTYSSNVFTFVDEVEGAQVTDGTNNFYLLHVKKLINFSTMSYNIGAKYDGYKTVTESKLLMYPYTQLVLDDFKGNRVTMKNEYINSSNLQIVTKGSMGPSNKTSYGIPDYNYNGGGSQFSISDESALINNEPNDVPIVTDMLSAYLQGNKNSIQNQKNGIMFNGTMDVIGSSIGMISGAVTDNAMSSINSAMNGVRGLGNTVLSLQGIQAKQKDISNIPPSMAKMGSNTSYTIGNNYNGLFIIKKQIKDEYIGYLTNFFNMFGYKKNTVKYPNFHTRSNWNFVQTKSCVITASINNDDLDELKNIFDNGITLWHTDDIGNYSLTNSVL